jgi:hypothetical protein
MKKIKKGKKNFFLKLLIKTSRKRIIKFIPFGFIKNDILKILYYLLSVINKIR